MAKKKKNIDYDNLKKFKENLDKDIPKHKTLTQAEYDALTEVEKNNGTIYFIEDGNSAVADSDKDYIDSQDQQTLNSAKAFTTDTVKNYYTKTEADTLLNTKADMEEATSTKGGMFSAINKVKLDGIEEGAQVNTITGVKGSAETTYRIGEVNITSENIGLENVENKSSETIRGELTKDNVTTALGYIPPENDTTYTNATATKDGLLSKEDKSKLDKNIKNIEFFYQNNSAGLTLTKNDATTSSVGIPVAGSSVIGFMSITDKTKLDSLLGITLYKSGSIAINQSLQINLPKECYYIVVLKSGNPPHGIWLVDNVISYVGYSDVKQLTGYGNTTDPLVRKVDGNTSSSGEGMNGFVIQGCDHSSTSYKIYELPF